MPRGSGHSGGVLGVSTEAVGCGGGVAGEEANRDGRWGGKDGAKFQLGPQIAEEAGGVVSRMDGGAPSVFDRSILVASAAMHSQVSEGTGNAFIAADCEGSYLCGMWMWF